MKITASSQFTASQDVVWQVLLDPENIVNCLNGATITSSKNNTFTIDIGVPNMPFLPKLSGCLRTHNKKRPESYTLDLMATGYGSIVTGKSEVTLTKGTTHTTVSMAGDVEIKGSLGNFNERLIAGVIEQHLIDFLECMKVRDIPVQK